ncbi:hypothetical protein [Ulvibacterium sp.]|uniref:hypothetical protein n=1 Tax=Ulvibacterium sp. TaxID=2665914 RepID=UPI0026174A85|nr:hypothetical protein [Ulvibacterium sp.]
MRLNTDSKAFAGIASKPISRRLRYSIIVGSLTFSCILFMGCSTQRAIRLRDKSIKEWESKQGDKDKKPSDSDAGVAPFNLSALYDQ